MFLQSAAFHVINVDTGADRDRTPLQTGNTLVVPGFPWLLDWRVTISYGPPAEERHVRFIVQVHDERGVLVARSWEETVVVGAQSAGTEIGLAGFSMSAPETYTVRVTIDGEDLPEQRIHVARTSSATALS